MTVLAGTFEDLARRVNLLSERAVAGLFSACSCALLGEFDDWAAHCGADTGEILRDALKAANDFAISGVRRADAGQLLTRLDASAPHGEAVGNMPAGAAQDCWICADVAVRVLASTSYDPGPAIWFAVERLWTNAEEELLGPGPIADEEALAMTVVKHPPVAAALDFCRWATDFLEQRTSPTELDLAVVRGRAVVLAR